MRRRLFDPTALAEAVAVVGLLGVGAVTVIGAASRELRIVVPGADELSGYLFALSGLFGAASAVRHGAFIRVEVVTSRLRPVLRGLLSRLLLLLSVAYVAILVYGLADLVAESARLRAHSLGVLQTPQAIPQALIAIGLALLLIELARMLFDREPAAGPNASGEVGNVLVD